MSAHETTCPRCGTDFDVAPRALEAQCPECGAQVSFEGDGSGQAAATGRGDRRPGGSARKRFLTRPERTQGDGVGRGVQELEGVGATYARRLERAGVYTTDQLLWADEEDLAARTRLRQGNIRKWQDMADLLHVRGIGPQYAEVLVRCDVNSVNELAQESAEALTQRIAKRLAELDVTVTGGSIGENRVRAWIEEARRMRPQPPDPADEALRSVQDEPDGPQNPVITRGGVVEAADFHGRSFPADCPRCEATVLVAQDTSQGTCPMCDMGLTFRSVTRGELMALDELDDRGLAEEARHDAQRGFLERYRRQRQEEAPPLEVPRASSPRQRSLFRRSGGGRRG